jgi:hypothetical protein
MGANYSLPKQEKTITSFTILLPSLVPHMVNFDSKKKTSRCATPANTGRNWLLIIRQ